MTLRLKAAVAAAGLLLVRLPAVAATAARRHTP